MSLENFRHITEDLTDKEKLLINPLLDILYVAKGRERAVSNSAIIKTMTNKGCKINDVKVRKLINHIRKTMIFKFSDGKGGNFQAWLLACEKGYFFSGKASERLKFIQSLTSRKNELEELIKVLDLAPSQ